MTLQWTYRKKSLFIQSGIPIFSTFVNFHISLLYSDMVIFLNKIKSLTILDSSWCAWHKLPILPCRTPESLAFLKIHPRGTNSALSVWHCLPIFCILTSGRSHLVLIGQLDPGGVAQCSSKTWQQLCCCYFLSIALEDICRVFEFLQFLIWEPN